MKNEFSDVLEKLDALPDRDEITVSGSDSVFHYSSANGLLGIVSSNSLQLSNLKYLNDPNEIEYSKGLFFEILEATKFPLDEKSNKIIRESFIEDICKYIDYLSDRLFIFSTSLDKDSLHLWNYYGKNDGYSIEFQVDTLIDCFLNNLLALDKQKEEDGIIKYSVFLGKVIYNKEVQIDILKQYINLITQIIVIGIKYSKLNEALEYLKKYRFFLLTIMLNMKESFHSIESEYRVCIVPDKKYVNIKYKNKDGLIIPYISINKSILPIKAIGIGPKIKDLIAFNGIHNMVKNLGLGCDIYNSKISIR